MFQDRGYIIENKVAKHDASCDVSLILSGKDLDDQRIDAFIIYKRMGKNEIIKFYKTIKTTLSGCN